MINLPDFPVSGVNVHCLTLANICQKKGVSASEAVSLIRAKGGNLRQGRVLKRGEVERAVEKAYRCPLPDDPDWKPTPRPKKDKWEPVSTKRLIQRKRIELNDLWEASPIRCDEGFTQSFCLKELFPKPEALVCVGKSAFDFDTGTFEEQGDLSEYQFIVSSYMTKRIGITQDGKPSAHTLDNTGKRLYCVCDFDEPNSADHPSIIWELKDMARLVMVLSSGGKSLHAWFRVPPAREPSFWKSAIRLGADPALMRNRSSFVRIPEGTRDTGKKQTVFYFSPCSKNELDQS